ncbi:O-acetyl-ADP-ribose deacetylase [Providencia stuartii]|uniref:Appr-1-p processing domain-containing protein n=1 Tax=Providencia stuartii (strain MRSN 2154) TaxID=1157951 RepID=A0A140NG95_PROSM|nr:MULTISPECIES: O-acetyl-ADP-ribose deacetylase [Providencia]AFH92135.1 Appr-1-p processing domain-containing protein [Providencia stuartii MRSN 2154]MBN5557029.1 O-acetyl-ADP-ribose deacetylase [Providencia stuartii]MBQ0456954.1 O-acetyl-ADP-ribose deacetylase [Providencia stuartii]MBQ0694050.1 O-acetyl-ADP-ribose deacetylase [Providencia stuartii]MDE8747181.1 O-acetyl-ADP-ribose deacetylase [Providencia thailandensis]
MQTQIELQQGDITKTAVDAIVNTANRALLGGSGVDGAIHRAGGSAILDECRQIRAKQGSCKPGNAVITTAGKLPAKYVIHTVGPVWQDGTHEEAQILANAYLSSLRLASKYQIETIAFPNISTGIYRFPKPLAAQIACETVANYLAANSLPKKVIFVCFDEENYRLYQQQLQQV